MYAKDEATRDHPKTAVEMRRRRMSLFEEKALIITIDCIDFMISKNKVHLENIDALDENAENVSTHKAIVRSQMNSQAETSFRHKRGKKRVNYYMPPVFWSNTLLHP